ncbi:toll-like receptor 2 [Galleria mellonella]|uniref:Toll-like receptor 2 n=1 Tax=Galleria mellonella TaxID=7137 RepID=A0A6J3BXR0_GALME|nr:toll-like receptor 2 [Galleria mellonella]
MIYASYLWLLLCYAQNARSNLDEESVEELSNRFLGRGTPQWHSLPIRLDVDRASGCLCRSTYNRKVIVCFGNYNCKKIPRVKMKSDLLKVRTTSITSVHIGDLDVFYYLKILEIEANHQLTYIEPGSFRNLSNLEHLSISYNTALYTIGNRTFEGLRNLRNLTLVNNGFTNIRLLTPALIPSILPSLKWLDLSKNNLEEIPEDAFVPMQGTLLQKLDVCLCRLDFIHPNSFLPLKELKKLHIGENDLDPSLIGNFLAKMSQSNINLSYLDLSGMGFRKYPPKELMYIIAQTTIKTLILAQNQFEIIPDDAFPEMVNIELLDLRKVFAISIGSNTFEPRKFPNLKILLLGGNNLPGVHKKPLSSQLLLLDLSNNKGNSENPMYYEIDQDAFLGTKSLKILNIGFNMIKSIHNYTFRGLDNLKMLNMENGTLYYIGPGTFKYTKHLEILNLANNPLNVNGNNFTSAQFEGLNKLEVLILSNCGITNFNDDDNIFEMMPMLLHLILRNNQLYFITAETLKPLKCLQVLDLSENLLISWWKPLFLAAGVKPLQLYLTNNKISHFTISMIQDISYLLEDRHNRTVEIDLMNNVFTCDCSTMYETALWLEMNGSAPLRQYFSHSKFQCNSPDVWESFRVSNYMESMKKSHCYVYKKISNVIILVWTAPSLVTLILIAIIGLFLYKYRVYIKYWIFLAKLALGRTFIRNSLKADKCEPKKYKYDAFVSYSNEDREFISEVITQLEKSPPYLKLCIYERDFEIGSFISESVLSSINESKFVVLVISTNFARSQWCRWETQLAEYHRIFLEDGTNYDPLILIKIGEIESKYLTATLKFLMKTKVYHTWDENNREEFWIKLRNVLTKDVHI